MTDALDAVGVDLVMLGNNHTNDWRDRGVVNTQAALDQAGIAHVGSGLTTEEAQRGIIMPVEGKNVGVISLSGLERRSVQRLPAPNVARHRPTT